MNNYSDLQITQISPEVHLLPGVGFIEYVYTAQPNKHLTINVNGNEVKIIEGDEAKRVYFQVIGMNEETDPDEATIAAACKLAWGITLTQLKDKTRKPGIKDLRQIVMWHLNKSLEMPLMEIGYFFGGFDHSTVLHAVRRINGMQKTDKVIKHQLNLFETAIKQL